MKTSSSFYIGQQISLATMHKKELFLKASCEKILGASLFTFDGSINTDLLGTFSGEIEREGSQKEIVLKKCILGMDLSGLSIGMASEGSFGPHPSIPFVACSIETLVFVDRKRSLEIFESMLFTKTNYQQLVCSSSDELTNFLKHALFPSHKIIVRPHVWNDKTMVFKGIEDFNELQKNIAICCQNSIDHKALVETDMRAHMNPTRGSNIQKLGIRLFRRLSRLCPACQTPGWGPAGTKKGRPCSICEYPTELPMSEIWSCSVCSCREEKPFPTSLALADPRYCNMCNP